MKVEPTNQTFGIYQSTKVKRYGRVIQGIYKGFNIDIYIAENQGQIEHKLYYVKKAGEWFKSKLVFFSNGEKYKSVISEAKNVKTN